MSPEPPPVRILYLSRDGVLDGLGESQILGYLRALGPGFRIWLVTFEARLTGVPALRARLMADRVQWVALEFFGRSTPFRALLNLVRLLLSAIWLTARRRVDIIHARGYLPCVVAIAARALSVRRPRVIFDMRGFWIDERAESGQWVPGGRMYRAGKRLERWLLHRADAVVTLNDAAAAEVARLRGAGSSPLVVIPTCVDTERFRPGVAGEGRKPLPAAWRDRIVFVYTGGAGFWQDPGELVRFFSAARQERPDAAFVCLLRSGGDEMRARLAAAGLDATSIVEEAVDAGEVARWLRAATVGVVWYRPTFSRLGNFPTKLGEYLACGLPVVIAGATADSVDVVVRNRVGVVVRDFAPAAYAEAVAEAVALAKDPETARRCRQAAERELALGVGVERYRALYRRLREVPA